MKKLFTLAALVPGLFLAGTASAASWSIDPAHTAVSFKVRHMMVTDTRGEFQGVAGTVDFDPTNPTAGTIAVDIDVGTVQTRNEKRDGHLKSPDFFNVGKFPKATFTSTRITKAGGNAYKVEGKLTLKGVTKKVTLDAELSDPIKSPWGQTVIGVHASTTINRQDFGVSWNKKLDKGGVVVGNDVHLMIDMELIRKDGKSS